MEEETNEQPTILPKSTAGHITLQRMFRAHEDIIWQIAWSPDGSLLASGSADNTVRIWDAHTAHLLHTLEDHTDAIFCVAWSPDGSLLASSSADNTVRIWNSKTMQSLVTLEGHTDDVASLSFNNEGLFLASRSFDGKVYIWHTSSWETVELLENVDISEYAGFTFDVAFHPHKPILATVGPAPGNDICVWDVNINALLNAEPIITSIHYTSAKIALVGDSGVGKSGLGYRIAEERFQITESTHGQQFWPVEKLAGTRRKGTQCEAILWDFAGQPNFRPIHSLFLDDIDLALVVFDPSRADSMVAVEYWLKQLSYKEQLCPTILVAARTDVSQMTLSTSEFEAFCYEHNISGSFIATSAKTNTGIDELVERILEQLDWNRKPTTVTTETFKHIKDYVKGRKARATNTNIIVTLEQLRDELEKTDAEWKFDDDEMVEAVRHLQNHGYVALLRLNSHEQSILLTPDLLINLAWGDAEHERWVSRLAHDLKLADLHIILDKWDNAAIGASITRFVSRIEKCNFILAIGTPSYRQKYENEVSPQGSVVAAEVDLINRRYIGTEAQKATIKPLLLAGEELTSFPPFMHGRVYANFTREEDYLAGLFELVLTLYSIPFDDPLVLDWREKLRDDAKNFMVKGKGRKSR